MEQLLHKGDHLPKKQTPILQQLEQCLGGD